MFLLILFKQHKVHIFHSKLNDWLLDNEIILYLHNIQASNSEEPSEEFVISEPPETESSSTEEQVK